ncbi:DUF305 domain-containing protein [Dermatophilus congolensis]|uniref:Uncharacterized protein conserved in bacteria n=1 Tax=Dermatophilus congolensis TaxID=1863 RepID=A0AA46BPW7_9MICO|nr:DUF305 domain-containing protein [Dermatophilus congolensis]MBO3143791.1 DUF305 domain-containing protein [Dermatophilus congolensis]MBO3152782.1 DUF305 domain-containing protein [Dermatophilus congolensis]MBO3160207.1 DUF305 domain-containing protein [Dermatophilus congolensis]MBO3164067.1 DUF305 domain-containing protein [Dermatophilus congolensis]MBO3177612.1 DUF305 domain-containing protein [Dermatophilus congolensis]
MTHHRFAAAVSLTCALALAGCGKSASSPTPANTSRPASSHASAATSGAATADSTGDAEDLGYVAATIPLNDEIVEAARLALDPRHRASAKVQAAATQIRRTAEVRAAMLTSWRDEWTQNAEQTAAPTKATDPAQSPGKPSAGRHGATSASSSQLSSDEDMGDEEKDGADPDDLEGLAAASGTQFDALWLQHMIDLDTTHIDLAENAAETTENPELREFALQAAKQHTQEVRQLRALLTGGPDDSRGAKGKR